ncbi:hypothetical protein Acr_26g0003520 [Actinidia rufa]|uniref:Uncharacterized protein n=1 Tax=Actinidia rufa TaxID=165716 RepID=A0A7J0H210_9ERIC|nr:hypothetical protein Acr_26g0003520 [Actinidia rufa]
MPPLEDKKKGSSGKAPAKSRVASNAMMSKGVVPTIAPEEGTLANPGAILGLNASMLENPDVVEKLLKGVIPPLDKKEVGRLDLDRVISSLFYGMMVLVSSLFEHGRELKDEAMTQQAWANSVGSEIDRAQQLAKELEGKMAKIEAWEQQVIEELSKMKEDRDATMARLSSDDFLKAVEFTASKYFGKGFDFCKRQISHLHPDLDIHGMGIDTDLLEEEKEKENEEENEEEKEEKKEGELDNSPTP